MSATTVNIALLNIVGAAVACQAVFTPLDTPLVTGTALVGSGAQSIQTAADGTGSIALEPGRYSVQFLGIPGNADALTILVPPGGPVNLTDPGVIVAMGASPSATPAQGGPGAGILGVTFANFRVRADGTLELFNPTTGKFYAPRLLGEDGALQLFMDVGDE